MDVDKSLNIIFDWFRAAGGTIGDTSETPIELKLGNGLFYVGYLETFGPAIELSALLYLGTESTANDQARVDEVADTIIENSPDDITVDTMESIGTDIWAAISFEEDDFDSAALGSRIRAFVDYSFRAMDEIQHLLHPLDIIQATSLVEPLAKLRQLVGVDELVQKADELVSLSKVNQLRATEGLKASSLSPHLVFAGNPGTGKTTVARLIGEIYKDIGLLKSGHLVEARRSDLIGQFVGQTTPKTEAMIKASLDGVLFIDEAYSLMEGYNTGKSFGDECVAALLLAMENFRGRFALIVAGYPQEMKEFIQSNPGLRSRFDQFWHFRDYTNEELVTIVERYVAKNDYLLAEGCGAKLLELFSSVKRDKFFGNARLAREIFHTMKRKHADRITKLGLTTRADLMTLTPEDIQLNQRSQARPQIGFTVR